MDLLILIGIATALLIVLCTLFFLQKKNSQEKPNQREIRDGPAAPQRAQIVRNQRNRLRQNAAVRGPAAIPANANNDNHDDEDEPVDLPQGQVLDEKMGAKKRAKLEAKEQKRLMREQDLKQREERKAKEAKEEEEKKRQEEREAEDEKKQEEAERLAREERERKEHEEYLKMKEAFSVEEEGYEGNTEEEKDSLLANFVQFIKDNKVVVLEDLAQEFKLHTQQVIDHIQEMRNDGTLTGVIDDRGKFIYISEDELKSVAKFIKQRGRVSIVDLAESSNNLISLVSATSV